MNAETLKELLANATPGIRDVSRIGYVHIGGVMYPHVDQTRHEAESWIDMRHRVQLELDKAEAECVANAKLESLSYVLAADNIALQAEVEDYKDKWTAQKVIYEDAEKHVIELEAENAKLRDDLADLEKCFARLWPI